MMMLRVLRSLSFLVLFRIWIKLINLLFAILQHLCFGVIFKTFIHLMHLFLEFLSVFTWWVARARANMAIAFRVTSTPAIWTWLATALGLLEEVTIVLIFVLYSRLTSMVHFACRFVIGLRCACWCLMRCFWRLRYYRRACRRRCRKRRRFWLGIASSSESRWSLPSLRKAC